MKIIENSVEIVKMFSKISPKKLLKTVKKIVKTCKNADRILEISIKNSKNQ